MRRIEYDRYGGPDLMHLADVAPKLPAAHDVQVKVMAASVNPVDWKLRDGALKLFSGKNFPRGMGSDFSGVVQSVGPQVTRFKVGDDVIGTTTPKNSGAFAELVTTADKLLVVKPAALSYAQAAVLPIPGGTAWIALVEKAKLQAGQRIFVNGALGSVGRAAIAIARMRGATVAGRVGAHSLAEASTCGLDPALDYAKSIPADLNGAFDVVFDTNGSLSAADGDRLRKPGGVVIDINPTTSKLLRMLLSRHRKLVFFNGKAKTLEKVVALAANGQLSLPIGDTVKLDKAIPAITALERGKRQGGKLVLQVN
ncbi:NADP-dependent oxidoreductase [Lichenicoccus sp.]|uniref:NADP-dependent oxidoreductase n=1 Tax=Lichenicoccus sp. TaxID=2781899 RepID=UPI003D10692F